MKKSKNILIIDDSNTNLVLLEAILSARGYSTITARSVKDALSKVKHNLPDLIFLDLLMPEISGFEFLENIRLTHNLNNVPVIVVSALTEEKYIDKSKELGAIEFIKKPIDINSLVNLAEKILKNE